MATRARRRSRIVAFQALFEADESEHEQEPVLDFQLSRAGLDPEAEEFARELVHGVRDRGAEIDAIIEQHAPAFPLSEMAPVDRSVLRLAIYEVLFDNRRAPLRVAINEAVEIAKGYGSESSGRFVNGVLGSVALQAAATRPKTQIVISERTRILAPPSSGEMIVRAVPAVGQLNGSRLCDLPWSPMIGIRPRATSFGSHGSHPYGYGTAIASRPDGVLRLIH